MSLFNLFGSIGTNIANRKIAKDTNEFNAEQNRLNREFQAQQAQIARDWQEEQYQKYTSPAAMVQQYRDAGLNPALMYGQNLQSSTGSSPSPSGSAASGTAIPDQAPNLTGIVQDFLGLARLKSEIENIDADTEDKNASALLKGSTAELNRSVMSLNSSQMNRIEHEINLMREQAKTEQQKQNAIIIENSIKIAQRKQIDMKNAISEEFKRVTGVSADSDTIGMLLLSASNLVNSVIGGSFGLLGKLLPNKSKKL